MVKKFTTLLCMLCLATHCAPVHAGSIYVGNWTQHWHEKDYYNDTHRLLGIEADSGLFVMTMVNSFYTRSYLAGKNYGWFKLGVVSGYEDWYRNTGMRLMPFVAISYQIGYIDFEIVPGAFSWGLIYDF